MKILDIVLDLLKEQAAVQTVFRNRFKDDPIFTREINAVTDLIGEEQTYVNATILETEVFQKTPKTRGIIIDALFPKRAPRKEHVTSVLPSAPPFSPEFMLPQAAARAAAESAFLPPQYINFPINKVWENPELKAEVASSPNNINKIDDVFKLVNTLTVRSLKEPHFLSLLQMIQKHEIESKMEYPQQQAASSIALKMYHELTGAAEVDVEYFELVDKASGADLTSFIFSLVTMRVRKLCEQMNMPKEWISSLITSANPTLEQLRLLLNRMSVMLLNNAITEDARAILIGGRPLSDFSLVVSEMENHDQFVLVTRAHVFALMISQQLTQNRGQLDLIAQERILSAVMEMPIDQASYLPSAPPRSSAPVEEQAHPAGPSDNDDMRPLAYPQLKQFDLESKKAPLPPQAQLAAPPPPSPGVDLAQAMQEGQNRLMPKAAQTAFSQLVTEYLSERGQVSPDTVSSLLSLLFACHPEPDLFYSCLELSISQQQACQIIIIALQSYVAKNPLPAEVSQTLSLLTKDATLFQKQSLIKKIITSIGLQARASASASVPAEVSVEFGDDEEEKDNGFGAWEEKIHEAESTLDTSKMVSEIVQMDSMPDKMAAKLFERLAPSRDFNVLTHQELRLAIAKEEILIAFLQNPNTFKPFSDLLDHELGQAKLDRAILTRFSQLAQVCAAKEAHVSLASRQQASASIAAASVVVPASAAPQRPEFFTPEAPLLLAEYKEDFLDNAEFYRSYALSVIYRTLDASNMRIELSALKAALALIVDEKAVVHMRMKATYRPLHLAINKEDQLLNSPKPKDWHRSIIEIFKILVGVMEFVNQDKQSELLSALERMAGDVQSSAEFDRPALCRFMSMVIEEIGKDGCLKNITPAAQAEMLQNLDSEQSAHTQYQQIPRGVVNAHLDAFRSKLLAGKQRAEVQSASVSDVYRQGASVLMFAETGSSSARKPGNLPSATLVVKL